MEGVYRRYLKITFIKPQEKAPSDRTMMHGVLDGTKKENNSICICKYINHTTFLRMLVKSGTP